MIAEVAEAVMAAYRANADLSAGLSGGLFFQQAPQENDSPYAVFYLNIIDVEELMGGADDNITEVALQFNIFSSATDGGYEIADMTKRLIACYNWKTMYPSGFSCVWMKRESIIPLGYADEVWQMTVNFTIGIQED